MADGRHDSEITADLCGETARLLADARALLAALRRDTGSDDAGTAGVRVPRPVPPTAPATSARLRRS